MNPFDNEKDPIGSSLEGLLKDMHKAEAFREKLEAVAEKGSEEVEARVLVRLWAELGDTTETYWQAFNAAHSLVKALGQVRKTVRNHDPKIRGLLLRNLAILLADDADTVALIEKIRMEMEHGAPAKPYPLE